MKVFYSKLSLYSVTVIIAFVWMLFYGIANATNLLSFNFLMKLVEMLVFSFCFSLITIFFYRDKCLLIIEKDEIVLWNFFGKKRIVKTSDIKEIRYLYKLFLPILIISKCNNSSLCVFFLTDKKREKICAIEKILKVVKVSTE